MPQREWNRGQAHALLFEGLWSPGIGLVADLLAIARQRRPGREEERAGAVMLLASLELHGNPTHMRALVRFTEEELKPSTCTWSS